MGVNGCLLFTRLAMRCRIDQPLVDHVRAVCRGYHIGPKSAKVTTQIRGSFDQDGRLMCPKDVFLIGDEYPSI